MDHITTPTRIPRPMGTTLLSTEYQKEPNDANLQRLQKHLINQYTLSGFRYSGQPMPIDQFALLTGIPIHDVNRMVAESGKDLGAFNSPEQIQDTITSIISLSTNWAIQDKGLINRQIEILARAQGDSYKPFISAELTKALKTGQDANKNLMEVYRTFFTNNTTNILNIYGGEQDEAKVDYVTPEDAFNLVNESLPSPSKNKQLPHNAIEDIQPLSDDASPDEIQDYEDRMQAAKEKQRTNDQSISIQGLDKLFEEHRLGDSPDCLEGRSGTASLQRVEVPQGPEAEAPVSLQAKRKSSHQEADKRRGHDYLNTDDI